MKALYALFIASLIGVALFLLPAQPARAQTSGGKFEGQIVNGTKDAPITNSANLTVTLLSAPLGATVPLSVTTRADANGRFVFTNLDTMTTTRYAVLATYKELDYYSDVVTFSENQTTQPITVTIHETTEDVSAVRVSQTHFIVEVVPGSLGVTQIIVLQNTSDRTYIGKPLLGPHRATLTLPILAGASNLQFENPEAGATTLVGSTVLTYTLPVYPGMDQIVYAYELSYTSSNYPFRLTMPFDSAQVRILLADVGGTINSTQFATPAPFSAPTGQKFLQTTMTNVTAGTTLNATFTKLPAGAEAPAQIPDQNTLAIALGIVGAVALAVFALLIRPFLNRRKQSPRDEILEEIVALDDDFEAGKIAEEEYRAERAELKAELKELDEE